jgi:hypothetical protein
VAEPYSLKSSFMSGLTARTAMLGLDPSAFVDGLLGNSPLNPKDSQRDNC